jgi:hypothetical protein
MSRKKKDTEQDIKAIIEKSAKQVYRKLNKPRKAKREGVLDLIPQWIPESNQIEIEEASSQVLRQGYSKKDIFHFMNELSKMVDEGGAQADFPVGITRHLGTLVLYQKAIRLGKTDGLELLLGGNYADSIIKFEKVKIGGQKGTETTHGDKNEIQERAREYQSKINELHKMNKKLSYTQLSIRAGEYYAVSAKTIRNHTTDPTKKQILPAC